MTENTAAIETVEAAPAGETAEQTKARVIAGAADEHTAVVALAAAGWVGRTATATLDAARELATAKGRMAQKKAEEELAKAAAKAAGATGLAAHDRDRITTLYTGDIPAAAAATAPTREGTARALVWFVAAIEAAEAELV